MGQNKAEQIKQLNDAITQLLDTIRRLEEALAREQFENQTLRSQINSLKADLRSKQRQLSAIRRK
jgi:predicted  nucleic acid-binding Zn-ribbon protein